MAFNIFSTLNQNLQNFGGDAYDAYQAGKSKVGNVASTINNNLQDFGGDVYDVGSTIKKNVSNFGTQTYNQGKNVANTIQKNVGDYYEKGLKPIPGQVYDATIGRATDGFIDYAKGVIDYGREREASNVGIEDSKALKVMQAMKDEGYSKDEILAQMSQFDAEEKARKQQEWAQKQQSNYENASLGRKALAGSVNFVGGAEAGMMRLPAGVTDFVTGGTDYTKDTMQGINDFTSRSGAAKVGDIAGQIAATSIIPGVGRIAPSGAGMGATIGRGSVYGGVFGGLTPIMNKGSEATFDDIGESALTGAAMGAVAGPLLEKGIPALVKGTQSGIKAGQYTNGSISDKLGAGGQAFVKSMGRQTKQGVKETVGSISSAYQNAKPFVRDTVKKPYQFTQDKVQSLLSNSSDKTKSTIAQTYGLENQEIGALRNMGEQGVSDAMKKMEAIDKTALEGGGVNSIYDDLHKEIMTGVGRRSKEISTLEAQKDKILQSSPVVVKQAELESIFDDVLKAQGIQRTQVMTKKGIKNVYTVVGEGNITKGDIANIEKLYNEVFRTKGDVSALNMNTRIKNLQGNLYNKDQTAVYGSDAMTGTAKSIVAKVNELLKKKLPPEYGIAKEAQSKILQQRQVILKALKEEDNALALLSDDAIANMSEKEIVKLMNDSIAGNKMALVLRRLANSTTTGGDAKQLANIIKEFTGVDAESKAIALRAIAKLTGNQQIMNELGGLIEKGIMKGSLGFIRKTLAPSPDKVIKAVATKPPIVSKAKPKATKPPIVPKAKPKATTESAFKNNKGFINPSEIKKSLIPKKGADEARQFYDDLVYAGNSPIVAQRETAKRFGTIRAMSASKAGTMDISKAPDALVQEAKKYKGLFSDFKEKIDDIKLGGYKNIDGDFYAKDSDGVVYINLGERNPNKYKPTENIDMKGYENKSRDNLDFSDRNVFVDGSNILDGHHRWLRAKTEGKSINVYKAIDIKKEFQKGHIGNMELPFSKDEWIKRLEDVGGNVENTITRFKESGIKTIVFKDGEYKLLDIYNKANTKSSLPMSAKSEVKYSKPDLASEAKKYKSADEFVNSNKLFHGTSNEKYNSIQKTGFKTPRELAKDGKFEVMMIEDHVSFTGDKKVADRYALRDRSGGKVIEIDKSNLNLLNDKSNRWKDGEEWIDYIKRLEKEGYDGIDGSLGHPDFGDYYQSPGSKGDTEVLIWNTKKIKEITKESEQKLRSIWEQANKK